MKQQNKYRNLYIVQVVFLVLFTLVNVYFVHWPVKAITPPAPDVVYSDSLKTALEKVDSLQGIINMLSAQISFKKKVWVKTKQVQQQKIDSIVSLPVDSQASYFADRTGADSLPVMFIPDTSFLVPAKSIRAANKLFAQGDAAKISEAMLVGLQYSCDSLFEMMTLQQQFQASSTILFTKENEDLRSKLNKKDFQLQSVKSENKALWVGGGVTAFFLVLSLIF